MNKFLVKSIILALSSVIGFQALACTDFRLTAKDGTVMITRSMEFAANMNANIRNSPRGKEVTARAPNNTPGLKWKAKYGYMYIDGMNQDVVVDGMNEAGMSFEYLYLPGETQYPTVPAGKEAQSLPYLQFGEWVLSNFKSIDEVKKALNDVYIYQGYLPTMPNVSFPLHASIYEASGKGIIVEFVNGKVNVFDSIGLLTNSPTYDWQVANLRNYLNLSPYVPKPITIDGNTYSATGQGSGSIGLPGDASPPSRFAKTAFLTTAAIPVDNKVGLLNLAEHIINNADIPIGIARSSDNGKETSDYTQWVVFKDLTNKVIYYRTYEDLTLRMVDLSKVDFSEKAALTKIPLLTQQYTIDMTTRFQQPNGSAPTNTIAATNETKHAKKTVTSNVIAVPSIKTSANPSKATLATASVTTGKINATKNKN